ncbi:hypothetical protein CK203_106871 [Vitis vinifera]|uniref:Uncharacterized protein n=1 Tax=Vitis vinifera TaxID=29760 RepID=A0A438ECN9_VITVI|nr:hypothetical protein CK203_106871 [Vitis vinifera]|eukprot:XP_019077116.1 PREDICTED: uncharacterized protein LOC100243987 isoform X1 [Vitis vinifera]
MAPKAFVILGILFFLMTIPSMKSESQTVKDSSSDEAAQNNPTDGGTAPSTTPVPPEIVVGGPPYRDYLPDRETSPYHQYHLVPSDNKFVLLPLALGGEP